MNVESTLSIKEERESNEIIRDMIPTVLIQPVDPYHYRWKLPIAYRIPTVT